MRIIRVRLSEEDLYEGAVVGVRRNIQSFYCKSKHGIDERRVGWQSNIDGAVGEMAVSKALAIHWDGALGNYQAKDVGSFQVRATTWPTGRLITHKNEATDDIYILVLLHALPVAILRGWKRGKDACVKPNWCPNANRPAFFTPQDKLEPMDELPQLAGGE